jgi:hypothetical protein
MPKNKGASKAMEFLIHDNGGRPFKVVANTKEIIVYKCDYDNNKDKCNYDKVCARFTKFVGYWTGFDSSSYAMHGNSILIKISNNEYVFIGWDIYSFKTTDVIEDYISPVGNNDVPYPVAYATNNVYFLTDSSYMEKSILLPLRPISYIHPN